MKKSNYRGARLLIAGMSLLIGMTQCSEAGVLGDQLEDDAVALKSGTADGDLAAAEVETIIFMREEEKLARDVYLHLNELFALRPMENISKSEQAHMDALLYLIETYGLEDPVGENPEGVFQNLELQELYDQLIESGSADRIEALKVGALIEEVDIIDLQTGLEESALNEEVVRVFTNLRNASERHLRAFVRVLELNGVDYEPVALDQAEFDRIMGE